jgi:hypothetical protein
MGKENIIMINLITVFFQEKGRGYSLKKSQPP